MDAARQQPFLVKDCALITLATGLRAQNLRELRDRIQQCPLQSIEHHFFFSQLQPSFDDPEYHNDFALWARRALHDSPLAERLGVLDPLKYADLEGLRATLLDVVEERLSESEMVPWASTRHEFAFLRSQVVVFDTGMRAETPAALAELIPHLSTGSVFYHFVEARRRVAGRLDDFRAWLDCAGPSTAELCERLALINYHFVSLSELRDQLTVIFRETVGLTTERA